MELSEDIQRLVNAAKIAVANKQKEVGKLERAGNISCADDKQLEIESLNISIHLLDGKCNLTQGQINSLVGNIACFVDPALASCPALSGIGYWIIERSPLGCPLFVVGGADENGLVGEFTQPEYVNDEFTIDIEP